jgi:arylsulfatase
MATSGGWSHAFLHVADILPTVLELAGASYPETRDGRPLAQPIGRSMLPILRGTGDDIRDGEGVGYELFEMKAYRSMEAAATSRTVRQRDVDPVRPRRGSG